MGQKAHPFGFRLGITTDWLSSWYADKHYRSYVRADGLVRDFLHKHLAKAGLEKVTIERSFNDTKVALHVSRPGVVIGRGGSGIELIRARLTQLLDARPDVEVVEVASADLSAPLIAQSVADQLERRRPFRRVMSYTAERVMARGALGVRISLSGLLGGSLIARKESKTIGSIPLQSLKSSIDFALATARTQKGAIGIKVWIYTGDKE